MCSWCVGKVLALTQLQFWGSTRQEWCMTHKTQLSTAIRCSELGVQQGEKDQSMTQAPVRDTKSAIMLTAHPGGPALT